MYGEEFLETPQRFESYECPVGKVSRLRVVPSVRTLGDCSGGWVVDLGSHGFSEDFLHPYVLLVLFLLRVHQSWGLSGRSEGELLRREGFPRLTGGPMLVGITVKSWF